MQGTGNDTYTGIGELETIERHLPRYNASIVTDILAACPKPSKVCEFGAGMGTLARIFREKSGQPVECVEIDPTLLGILKERGFATRTSLPPDGAYDLLYSSNVLEHIEDDVAMLASLRAALVPGGTLVCYVPACQFLYGTTDAKVGHFRRYGRREMRTKLEKAGFRVKKIVYRDSLGFVTLGLLRLFGLSDEITPGKCRKYDHVLFPVGRFLDCAGFSHVIGKNLLAVAVRE